MRILHTSDWHLGRSFLGVGMLVHQAAFVDHLLETVEEREVDLVVVPGDVYDRALPPGEAVALLERTLERLADSRATAVLTSGNHDSALRLGFASSLIARSGVHLRTDPAGVGTPVELTDEHGPVVVHALPYLDPDGLRQTWALEERSHAAVLGEALRRVRADLAARPGGTRSVLLAHAFVADVAASEPRPEPDAGATRSDSERDISVGGVEIAPLSLFADLDYVALGHLHGRATLSETVRYSGSPLAYSFSEAGHRKGSWLVDLGAGGVVRSEFVPSPVPRALHRLRGTLDELLDDPRHAPAEDGWVQAVLTDRVRPRQAKPRLEQRFPHLLSLAFEPAGATASAVPGASVTTGTSDRQVLLDFVRDVRGQDADAAERSLLGEAVDAVGHDTVAVRDARVVR
ncbi:exonuclease SbcCD subunit D [Marmoricola endophyticus]|uniref:exonuclease SbcCD subunit D n=1 Tax=Marmoricola endophyticus TaxID=2040280 RepID=UPI001667A4C9|nr:exonuclease SbcCD subunit D [Marmoricola endophyticus]